MARGRRSSQPDPRRYPRTARVSELLHEIVAEEIERIDDERLELVTVTHVHVDPDIRRAVVEFSSLGEEEDAALEALLDHRHRLQAAIGSQARLRRTPELRFELDTVIQYGARIEQLIAENPVPDRPDEDDATEDPTGPAADPFADDA